MAGGRCIYSLLAFLYFCSLFYHSQQTSQCEPITIPMCTSMQWNLTRMPNIAEQSSQQNARLKIEEYRPLVRDQCSEYLLFFLCAIFAPICTTNYYDNPVPPCQEICEEVKNGCESVIVNKYNKTWPEHIDCTRFPKYDNGVCISPQAIQLEGLNSQIGSSVTPAGSKRSCNCRKRTKLHIRRYIQANFGYVIKAVVEGTGLIGNDLVISLNIQKILKNRSDLRLKTNASLILWTEGDECRNACPVVRTRREYIIACSKMVNPSNGRLMFDTNTCMISRWKDKWARDIAKWESLARLPEVTRNRELRKLRHMKKSNRPSKRATTTQSSSGK